MRFKRIVTTLAAAAAAVVALVSVPPTSSVASDNAAGRISLALAKLGNNLVAQAVPSSSDSVSAARTATIDIPVDPNRGVRVATGGTASTINLPDAAHLSKGARLPSGAVMYRNPRGWSEVVVPGRDTVQLLTVVESANAPVDYTYPTGGQRAIVTPSGAALLLDANGKPVAAIAKPWAKDATGLDVVTTFVVSGNTLTQHIAHKESGASYPVVADPRFTWYWNGVLVTLSRADMATVAYGGTQALIAMLAIPGVGWVSIAAVLGMSAYAAWAYGHNKCAWFWLSVPASWGFYSC